MRRIYLPKVPFSAILSIALTSLLLTVIPLVQGCYLFDQSEHEQTKKTEKAMETVVHNIPHSTSIPLIDKSAPDRVETATFALG